MGTAYYALSAKGNLKTDDDKIRYYVEPVDGGGIEFTGDTLEDVMEYIESVQGNLEFIS